MPDIIKCSVSVGNPVITAAGPEMTDQATKVLIGDVALYTGHDLQD